jgi:hypothetical protein
MPMSPRLLRPRASGATHPDALDWATRVTTNGGTFTSNTLAAVSTFCASIERAGIRDRFYRLNLFCGDQLAAALVPLYRAESSTASVRGNATDTNNNFVAADFNNTGSASGLAGNGTSKFLNTGVNANSVTASNCHMGVGIAAAASGAANLRVPLGAFNNSTNALLIYGFDIATSSPSVQDRRAAYFSRYQTLTDGAGPLVNNAALSGRIIAAYPNCFINGSAHANVATTSQDYPSAHSMCVFGLNNSNTSTIGYFNGRLNWYSFGLTMTSTQATAFDSALSAFNSTLSRT